MDLVCDMVVRMDNENAHRLSIAGSIENTANRDMVLRLQEQDIFVFHQCVSIEFLNGLRTIIGDMRVYLRVRHDRLNVISIKRSNNLNHGAALL